MIDAAVTPVRVRVPWAALNPVLVLAGLVTASIAVRAPMAFAREAPRYLPDEYLYGELARSIARGDGPHVLGEPSGLPNLLAPIVQAVTWLPGDPELAFRLTQALNVVLMSLAAVPVFLLARRLGLRLSLAYAAALVTVVCPDLVYAGYATADALGYLLGLLAVHAAVRMLERPSATYQLAFLAWCGAATATRMEYVLLLPAGAAAALVVARGRPLRALARVPLPVAALGLAALAVATTGALGRYGSLASSAVSTRHLAWLPSSAFLLALACGAAVVPGAAAWAWHELVRPSRTVTAAFAAMLTSLLAGLLAASTLVSVDTGSERFFERYLMIVIPLVAVAFACWLEAERPAPAVALAAGALLVVGAARVPLTAYAEGQGRADSPVLQAVGKLEDLVGFGSAGVVAAAIVSVAALAGVLAVRCDRSPLPAAGATLALLVAVSAGAHAADLSLSQRVAAQTGSSFGWVDDAVGEADVTLVQTWQSAPGDAMVQAFANATVRRGALLGRHTDPLDGVSARLAVDARGALLHQRAPLRTPLLVAVGGTRPIFADAEVLARSPSFELVRPRGAARLAALAEGLGAEGWLGRMSRLTVYAPHVSGLCRAGSLTLSLPSAAPAAVAVEITRGGTQGRIVVRPGKAVVVRARTAAGRTATVELAASTARATPSAPRPRSVRASLDTRLVSCTPRTATRP